MPAKPVEFVSETETAPKAVQLQLDVDDEPIYVGPKSKRARVKGTWTQYFGIHQFDFVDGQTYELPLDLYDYLRIRGNIYDTIV